MDKFINAIFNNNHQNEKKRHARSEGSNDEGAGDVSPPLDGRRKLSISRSGRMKQNKKRNTLSLEVYGENFKSAERPKTMEYHVNTHKGVTAAEPKKIEIPREESVKSPDEEIDSAFAIVEKALTT